jgi:uncharacterized protein YecE (DUF72 family)
MSGEIEFRRFRKNSAVSAENKAKAVRIGCCGFPTSHQKYYEKFRVVEIQQSFYDLPLTRTAEKWKKEAPAGFEFTAKAWQLITHESSSPTYRRLKKRIEHNKLSSFGSFKPTDEVAEAWTQFLQFARALGVRKVVFQCPASFRPTPGNRKNMELFFHSVDRAGLDCIWEPRGDWSKSDIIETCKKCRLTHCTDPFLSLPLAGSLRYFRLHGIGGYRYTYSEQDLHRLLEMIDPGKTHYVMFNNMTMLEDAERFNEIIK